MNRRSNNAGGNPPKTGRGAATANYDGTDQAAAKLRAELEAEMQAAEPEDPWELWGGRIFATVCMAAICTPFLALIARGFVWLAELGWSGFGLL